MSPADWPSVQRTWTPVSHSYSKSCTNGLFFSTPNPELSSEGNLGKYSFRFPKWTYCKSATWCPPKHTQDYILPVHVLPNSLPFQWPHNFLRTLQKIPTRPNPQSKLFRKEFIHLLTINQLVHYSIG